MCDTWCELIVAFHLVLHHLPRILARLHPASHAHASITPQPDRDEYQDFQNSAENMYRLIADYLPDHNADRQFANWSLSEIVALCCNCHHRRIDGLPDFLAHTNPVPGVVDLKFC